MKRQPLPPLLQSLLQGAHRIGQDIQAAGVLLLTDIAYDFAEVRRDLAGLRLIISSHVPDVQAAAQEDQLPLISLAEEPQTRQVQLDDLVEESLRRVALWDEVKDQLKQNALELSLGQQQRLCIARVVAVEPEVILMDEPCSALDPITTLKIEDLIRTLKENYTIVIVTHNMQQAARVSDKTAFFLNGEIIEFDSTNNIFSMPTDKRTEDYITGRFG